MIVLCADKNTQSSKPFICLKIFLQGTRRRTKVLQPDTHVRCRLSSRAFEQKETKQRDKCRV